MARGRAVRCVANVEVGLVKRFEVSGGADCNASGDMSRRPKVVRVVVRGRGSMVARACWRAPWPRSWSGRP
jgi:hypothetical protein